MDAQDVTLLFALMTIAANVVVLVAFVLWVASRFSAGSGLDWLRDMVGGASLVLAWVVATVATLGSLYYSEVAHLPPCKLCWFQRIAMYPLPVILGIAAWKRDRGVRRYVIPLAGIGAAISTYHYQLERFPSQATLTCSVDVPCTTVWFWKFHYISIPLMALSAFLLVITLLLLGRDPDEPDVDDASGDDEEVAR
jgi:disulfide bond formation protein DsbB